MSFFFRFILDACWSIFLKNSWFYSIFIFHLISCYVRYFLRKHLYKSRGLMVSLLKIILSLLISKPSIPQSSIRLMVRKSYAQLIPSQQTWIKILPCYCRYQRWKLRADSIRCYRCIISCSPSSDRGYYREGTASSSPSILWWTDSNLLIRISLIHRHSIFQSGVTLSILRSILMKMKLDRQPLPLVKLCRRRPEIG